MLFFLLNKHQQQIARCTTPTERAILRLSKHYVKRISHTITLNVKFIVAHPHSTTLSLRSLATSWRGLLTAIATSLFDLIFCSVIAIISSVVSIPHTNKSRWQRKHLSSRPRQSSGSTLNHHTALLLSAASQFLLRLILNQRHHLS